MKKGFEKYIPYAPVELKDRQWPAKKLSAAPVWCSVDLRDGNQALIEPMNTGEKTDFFRLLCETGFKEIEVGFPSASETEYETLRSLIERNLIPDDVFVQILVPARQELIERSFDAIKGAKNVIVHLYNATSPFFRNVVFGKDRQGVIDLAVEGARVIKEYGDKAKKEGVNIRYEYSPEYFTRTEPDFALEICERVLDEFGADKDNRVIINLPSTVEISSPNYFADYVEYFCRNLKQRERAIISLHPHNDRGTAVAAAELGLLAGAERIEGTLFGNGERTGNVDIITLALNMYTQAIDPKLKLDNINHLREVFERTTKMDVSPRHPYAGELVFTAFSGSHQDAISKGEKYMKKTGSEYWLVPYLPIDPADIGREYEPIVRINSQSGKGGAAFVMDSFFGYKLPKEMHPEFGRAVKQLCDEKGTELSPDEVMALFEREYVNISAPYKLLSNKFNEYNDPDSGEHRVNFAGEIQYNGKPAVKVSGEGNGPIDAFFNALSTLGVNGYRFEDYSEHAISIGSDAKAVSYIHLKNKDGGNLFGVGVSHNINYASRKGILSAINRDLTAKRD